MIRSQEIESLTNKILKDEITGKNHTKQSEKINERTNKNFQLEG